MDILDDTLGQVGDVGCAVFVPSQAPLYIWNDFELWEVQSWNQKIGLAYVRIKYIDRGSTHISVIATRCGRQEFTEKIPVVVTLRPLKDITDQRSISEAKQSHKAIIRWMHQNMAFL